MRFYRLSNIVRGVGCTITDNSSSRGAQEQRDAVRSWATDTGVQIVGWVNEPQPTDLLRKATVLSRRLRAGLLVLDRTDRYPGNSLECMRWVNCAADNSLIVAFADNTNGLRSALEELTGVSWARVNVHALVSATNGQQPLMMPFGVKLGPNNQLMTDEREISIISRLRELRGKGWCLEDITKQLDAEGVVSRRGQPYSRHTLEQMAAKFAPVGRGRAARPNRKPKREAV